MARATATPQRAAEANTAADELDVARQVLGVRYAQLLINERYKAGAFRIPIHLALGHEAIAVAVSAAMAPGDQLVVPHRNLHYNLARGAPVRAVLDEFLLKPEGLCGGALGSMNLCHTVGDVIYASSILGNNLGVGAGVALGNRVRGSEALTFIVTGDGAMEEGAFHECLVTLRSQDLPSVIVIENNEWSMATRIEERRRTIDLAALASAYGAGHAALSGNDVWEYSKILGGVRAAAVSEARPYVVETALATLGDWRLVNDENPSGKHINYHAGPAAHVSIAAWPRLRETDEDPVHVLGRRLERNLFEELAAAVRGKLEAEIA
jgi:pyruvate dehydrogenase E1 component alpha subunit